MSGTAPQALLVRTAEGNEHQVVAAGASLPATGRFVAATQRPGQDALSFELLEEPDLLVARARFPLPRGLPANCWLPVEVRVSADLVVSAEAQENLRRLRIPAALDAAGATAERYRVA